MCLSFKCIKTSVDIASVHTFVMSQSDFLACRVSTFALNAFALQQNNLHKALTHSIPNL